MGMLRTKDEMQRKNFYLSTDLAGRAEAVARKLEIDFSQLLREALRQFVERMEREEMQRELVEACKNYREFNKKLSTEWAQFETRVR
jgi:post-segregation antitoxin (ccd killing protein)